MTASPAMRVNYFERQYLRLAEFRDEQAYQIALRRRHNLGHHSWGIVTGLAIVLEGGVPVVQPGLAIDGYGRELLLVERATIDRDVFDRYGTSRLDVWLEYDLASADAGGFSDACDPTAPATDDRAVENAQVVTERAAAADVDARQPKVVPAEALASPVPDTPDDPKKRWPVYLGRVRMTLAADGTPQFTVAQTALAYIGLNAELIDHPANPARIELGHDSDPAGSADSREIAGVEWSYQREKGRAFAVFVPPAGDPSSASASPINPTISVTADVTQILGTAEVHGDLVLDGTALVFPASVPEDEVATDEGAAIYRTTASSDEMRIDLGDVSKAARKLAIGVTKSGNFVPILEIDFTAPGLPPQVVVHGDLRVEGVFSGPDIRLRTLSQDLIPQLAAMLQVGVLSGSAP